MTTLEKLPGGDIRVTINGHSVTMTMGEWSKLLANPGQPRTPISARV